MLSIIGLSGGMLDKARVCSAMPGWLLSWNWIQSRVWSDNFVMACIISNKILLQSILEAVFSWAQKTRMLAIPIGEESLRYVQPFAHNSSILQTDGQTENAKQYCMTMSDKMLLQQLQRFSFKGIGTTQE